MFKNIMWKIKFTFESVGEQSKHKYSLVTIKEEMEKSLTNDSVLHFSAQIYSLHIFWEAFMFQKLHWWHIYKNK